MAYDRLSWGSAEITNMLLAELCTMVADYLFDHKSNPLTPPPSIFDFLPQLKRFIDPESLMPTAQSEESMKLMLSGFGRQQQQQEITLQPEATL